jgi:hypothetical protein
MLGHARVADLVHAFSARGAKPNGVNGHHADDAERITSPAHLHQALARMIQAEIVEPVRPESFRKPEDVYLEIRDDVTRTAPGEKATKKKDQQQQETEERFREYQARAKMLKRQLDQDHGPTGKRRKLENGTGSHQDNYHKVEVNVRALLQTSYVDLSTNMNLAQCCGQGQLRAMLSRATKSTAGRLCGRYVWRGDWSHLPDGFGALDSQTATV